MQVILLERSYHELRLDDARIQQRLGAATTRDARVIRASAQNRR